MAHKAIYALMVAGLATSGNANAFSGNDLIKWLPEYEQGTSLNSGMYLGYVSGVADIGNNILFCAKSTVTRGQLAAIVGKYLRNNPESWQEEASTLVTAALEKAFPCPEAPAKNK
ncbi:hypothetical protein HNR03_004024 [Pseudomonas sp. JAI111]|uniref:Rap1a/Tai family immunity protein n=1 Tax=Pseudomonas sp. JAI111 TaxID=2735913 RepID=UPI00216814F4|nr:Rap1a/Tai family immunity protein [Pseudomonas sp. JAI111]MCS3839413.1 hypothetical protein [Pseudomonas sp. JAI111]